MHPFDNCTGADEGIDQLLVGFLLASESSLADSPDKVRGLIDCIEHKGCMSNYNTFEKNEFLTSNVREKYKIVKESYFLYVIV